jgi:hypothetical protein
MEKEQRTAVRIDFDPVAFFELPFENLSRQRVLNQTLNHSLSGRAPRNPLSSRLRLAGPLRGGSDCRCAAARGIDRSRLLFFLVRKLEKLEGSAGFLGRRRRFVAGIEN